MSLGSKAHFLYGQNTPSKFTTDLVPRSKYNFTVSMNHQDPAAVGGLTTTLFERIQSITMPGYSVRGTTLNQYNKKRVVQTGIDYSPITLLAYDDRRGDFEKFLKQYSEYYYSGSMNYGTSFVTFNNKVAGTRLNEQKNYIKELTIKRINSITDTNVIRIYNPMITSIDADTLDYSESSLVQYRISFIYEGYDISTEDVPAVDESDNNSGNKFYPGDADYSDFGYTPPAEELKNPKEPTPEKENPATNVDVKDSRFDQYIGINRAQAKDLSDEERQAIKDSGEYIFVQDPDGGPSTLQRRDAQPPLGTPLGPNDTLVDRDGKVIKGADLRDGDVTNKVTPVDEDNVTSSKVIAESKDKNGNVTSRVIEEKGVDADGFGYTETRREDVKPVEYREYDHYVGQSVDTLPDDIVNDAADSGAYYEDTDGTLKNYADDPSHADRMSNIVTPDEGFTDYDRRSNEHVGYNATLNKYERFDSAQDAVDYAKYGDDAKAANERFVGNADDERSAEIARRLEEKRQRKEKRREEMGEEAYQAMLDKYRPKSSEKTTTGNVDSNNDPAPRYTAESESFETDADPYEDIGDEYLNEE